MNKQNKLTNTDNNSIVMRGEGGEGDEEVREVKHMGTKEMRLDFGL